MGRNVDVFAVFVITLALLGFAQVRSEHSTEPLDSIRIEKTIQVERPLTFREVLSNLSCILHE